MGEDFEQALRGVINSYSKENDSGTPDWILATYLRSCLDAYAAAVAARAKWYGQPVNLIGYEKPKPIDFGPGPAAPPPEPAK